MEFENTCTYNWLNALRGMRNPKESWNKNDTTVKFVEGQGEVPTIGPNDLKLAKTLIKCGNEHRKFLRQLFVSVDITAPRYWWSEFDTYKVATVANSTSTMHKLAATPITKECFEMGDYENFGIWNDSIANSRYADEYWNYTIDYCEGLRLKFLETKDKKYWKELIRVLPSAWLQKRTVTLNYENLLGMCSKGQRRNHKLNEWSGKDKKDVPNFIAWARTLPYAQEFLFGDELTSNS